MKRRFKKHNNGCNGKFVLINKDASGNKYQCNKCEFEIIKRKKTGGWNDKLHNQTINCNRLGGGYLQPNSDSGLFVSGC